VIKSAQFIDGQKSMVLEITSPILGFESLQSVTLEEIDSLFATLYATHERSLSFTVCNPFALLQEYAFDIPDRTKEQLGIQEGSPIRVVCIVVPRTPIEASTVNFLAPIVINTQTQRMAQVALDKLSYPHFDTQKPISDFI